MKVQGYKIYGYLLLICAIGLSVSICSSVADSKIPLSNDEMSAIYGGEWGPVGTKDYDGCSPPTTNCEDKPDTEQGCTGTYSTSCKQEQKECANGDPDDPCEEISRACGYETYEKYKCVLRTGECTNVPYRPDLTFYCSGVKDWARAGSDPF